MKQIDLGKSLDPTAHTVSYLEIHKWEPDIYIGFSSAILLQCEGLPLFYTLNNHLKTTS